MVAKELFTAPHEGRTMTFVASQKDWDYTMSERLMQVGGYLAALFGKVGSTIASFVVASALAYWTSAPEALKAALIGAVICTAADTCLGVYVAWSARKADAKRFSLVFSKLLVYFAVYLAAYGVDYATSHVTGTPWVFQTIIALNIIFREVASLCDFAKELHCPIGEDFQRHLEEVQDLMLHKGDSHDEGPK